MSSLVDGAIGPEAKYELELKDGKLLVKLNYDGAEADASLVVSLEVALFLDKVKGLIPGQIDDAVIEMLKGVLK